MSDVERLTTDRPTIAEEFADDDDMLPGMDAPVPLIRPVSVPSGVSPDWDQIARELWDRLPAVYDGDRWNWPQAVEAVVGPLLVQGERVPAWQHRVSEDIALQEPGHPWRENYDAVWISPPSPRRVWEPAPGDLVRWTSLAASGSLRYRLVGRFAPSDPEDDRWVLRRGSELLTVPMSECVPVGSETDE